MRLDKLLMIFTPDQNDGNHIFVFGSNLAGRHGKGAALTAVRHWGAKPGNGNGWTGQAYAIPTKDRQLKVLPLPAIKCFVDIFLEDARAFHYMTFLVTPIGCGLAGYKESDIRPMFDRAPPNCVFAWSE